MSAMLKSSILTLGQITDPEEQKAKILEDIGSALGKVKLYDNQVLVALYVTPSSVQMQGPGGKTIDFQFTDRKTAESQFQGKAALLLKKGPTAYKYNAGGPSYGAYEGIEPEIGEWVVVRPSDGLAIALKSLEAREHVICKVVPALAIQMGTEDPRLVY